MPKKKFDWRVKLDTGNSIKFNALLSQTSKYEHLYKGTDDPQTVQMWLGMLEIYKKQEAIAKRLDTLEKKLFSTKSKKRAGLLGDLENY